MGFSPRRVLTKQLAIFNATGQLIRLWIPINVTIPQTYTPGQLFTQNEDPEESDANYRTQYIRGKFLETDIEVSTGAGRRRYARGIISCPMIFKTVLAAAEYIDPYLDGSRFVKDGNASPDEERVFITQGIKLLSATSPGDIQ
jgi:hypothetical protein